jgi:hypothetical protein
VTTVSICTGGRRGRRDIGAESIESAIEDQAFLQSYGLAPRPPPSSCPVSKLSLFLTVRTVAVDLRRGEHIPKMQNNKGRKSMLRVLRQLRSKDGGAGCRAVPGRATPRGARPGAAFSTTAVNLRQIEFSDFGSGSAKNTRMGSIHVPSDL